MPKDDSVKKVRDLIESLDRDGEKGAFPDNPNIPPFRAASIPTEEGESLRKWVIKEKAGSIIEVGLAYGFSALYLGEGLLSNKKILSKKPKHTIVDAYQVPEDKYAGIGLDVLDRAGLREIVDFYGELSQVALPRFLSEGRKFDFGFIDGCHLFDCVFLDLFYAGRLVRNGGIIFIDDYDSIAIRKAATFFIRNLNWKIEEKGSRGDREWLVMRTPKEDFNRHYTYFVDF
jgi:predicted O-methyltransferase YrrM